MTTTNEIEILLKKAVTLLHSSHANSATELRLLLDEEIKKRYGSEKTITNSLSKKQLDDEANFPGRAATPPPQPVETEEVINLIHSPAKTISDSPDTIADSDDAVSGAGGILSTTAEDETNLKEFGDLNCCVCGEIRFTATNRLIECSKCGALYHQECHKPPISDEEASEEQGHNWQCDNCIGKPTTATSTATTKLSGSCTPGVVVIPDEPMPLITNSVPSIKSKSSATSSRSSSSSNSSSPYHKMEHVQVVNSVVSGKTSSSSSKSHREDRMSTGSSSSKVTTINSSSLSSTSSTNKKHSSSGKSKSSKHHDSKRKSNK